MSAHIDPLGERGFVIPGAQGAAEAGTGSVPRKVVSEMMESVKADTMREMAQVSIVVVNLAYKQKSNFTRLEMNRLLYMAALAYGVIYGPVKLHMVQHLIHESAGQAGINPDEIIAQLEEIQRRKK